jgi:hypothetical protein
LRHTNRNKGRSSDFSKHFAAIAGWYRKISIFSLGGCLALALCDTAVAQGPTNLVSSDQAGSASVPQKSTAGADDNWHIGVSPYLWFAGVHGNVGAHGETASVHASAGDVLSHFNIGLMGAVEARKNHFVTTADFMWIKLSDDKSLPEIGDEDADYIKAKMTETLLTPKVGYRLVNSEKLQADALVGIRYWHLGTNLSLQPNDFRNVSQSANWVDVVAGAKISMPLSPKAVITVLGDAGGGGASVDYQVAGLLGYKLKPNVILQAGWRYLDVNYRPSSSFVYDVAQNGLLLGVTINLK